MPTYEYICSKCGHQFELGQSISEPPIEICPKDQCSRKRWGRGKVKRAISGGAGLLFKGSGFYITDYRSDNYKEAARKEKTAATGGDSKTGSKKGESKPSGSSSETKSTTGTKKA